MNRALLNPFEVRDLPKGIEEFLEQPEKATCMRFNRHGNLLAVGTRTGTVVLWDFDTHSIAKVLGIQQQTSFPVTSVSFPAPCNGSHVLVSYEPGIIRIYATLSASLVTEVLFDFPLIAAVPHPKEFSVVIAIPKDSHPIILFLRRGIFNAQNTQVAKLADPCEDIKVSLYKETQPGLSGTPLLNAKRPKHAFGNKVIPTMPDRKPFVGMALLCAKEEFVNGKLIEGSATRRKSPFCVTFTRGGRYILRGSPGGIVRTFQLTEPPDAPGTQYPHARCVSAVVVQGKAAIRSIQLSRRDEKVLVNSHDRAMRLFSLDQLVASGLEKKIIEPKTTFTEIVNKSQCQSACFSRDGDFVLGGMEGTDHRIHVWRTADGFLDLTLEGPREGIVEILWHPLRPVIASLGSNVGGVYVWMKNFTENWSAFAAEFNELEANEEYKEAEDEFDLKDPEDDEKRLEAREKAEAKDVDIETIDVSGWFSSDSDEEDTFFFVPADPKPDPPSNHLSLADEIIAQKVAEARRESDIVEETELGGQNGTRESTPPGRRKRQRALDGIDPKPHPRRKIRLKRRMRMTAENAESRENGTEERTPKISNDESGSIERANGTDNATDIEIDGEGPHGETLLGSQHQGQRTEDSIEEELLEAGHVGPEAC